jgi:hypothetical protein
LPVGICAIHCNEHGDAITRFGRILEHMIDDSSDLSAAAPGRIDRNIVDVPTVGVSRDFAQHLMECRWAMPGPGMAEHVADEVSLPVENITAGRRQSDALVEDLNAFRVEAEMGGG